jgi:diamine N-acetyltransferase
VRNPVMVGDRVYLRPFELDDAPVLAEATHRETETFMEPGRELEPPFGTAAWIAGMYDQHPAEQAKFAVCLSETDECVGLCGLEYVDLINRVAESGSRFHNPAFRNRGYGTEAKHLVLEYAFHWLHLERIFASVFEPNTRSVAALVKQGYKPAGRLKYEGFKNGRYCDALFFELTEDDWQKARQRWYATQDRNQRVNN